MKKIKLKYLILPLATVILLSMLGFFLSRLFNTTLLSPFTPKPEDIVSEFIEVNNVLNNNGKSIPVPEEDLRKNLLDQIKEIENVKNDYKPFEESEKFARYMNVYNVLDARYNATHDEETRNILLEFQTFLHANYKERYERIEREHPEIWEVSE